jgi:hypothetical protein
MNFVRSSNGDVVTFRYSPNNQIIFSESVVALTATFVYEGATLFDSVFGPVPDSWQNGNPDITQLTLGTSATSIGSYAFYYCLSLTGNLTIPNSVTSIGSYAFTYCSSFTGSLTIPGTTSIGDGAFNNCTFNGLNVTGTSISANQFNSRQNITGALSIANTITTIGNFAFINCTSLSGSLTIPNSVTSIGSYAFYYCTGFTGSLTIPNSVTSIASLAFQNCTGFTGSLTIPNSVTSIGSTAFKSCSNLTNAYLNQPLSAVGSNAFQSSGITTISLRPSPNTPAGWTIGSGQTIGGKAGVTVVADWTTYPDPP